MYSNETSDPAPSLGDFFQSRLPRADLFILARVLHDWTDGACVRLLRRAGGACGTGGRDHPKVSEVTAGSRGHLHTGRANGVRRGHSCQPRIVGDPGIM